MIGGHRVDRRLRAAGPRRMHALAAGSCAALLVILQTSCVVLPVRIAGGVSGTVIDQVTGEPVEGALVVVRFEGHYDDVLPDREVLGHRETTTDSGGHFRVGTLVRPGISAWPRFQTEARVVAVMREGYRCPGPRAASDSEALQIGLEPSTSPQDRRDSCRPVSARKGEATVYMEAWRGLFPDVATADQRENARQLDRLLSARAAFGFGENCEGPALDLALSPDGRRAAFSVSGDDGSEVRVVELRSGRSGPTELVTRGQRPARQRLVWTQTSDLLLFEAADDPSLPGAPDLFAAGHFERIWSASGPASHSGETLESESGAAVDPVVEPEDLDDEGEARWHGRSFSLERSPDPQTGLPVDQLRVYRPDASSYAVPLPGEPCGPVNRFGRPHYRIAADGRTSLDLRYVEGGCHAVWTDVETGDWATFDLVDREGTCRASRQIQAAHFRTALRGYATELETAVVAAGADPEAAYSLRIASSGQTQLRTRGFAGESVTLDVPKFPLDTPLRRIEVSTLGGSPSARIPSAPTSAEPL